MMMMMMIITSMRMHTSNNQIYTSNNQLYTSLNQNYTSLNQNCIVNTMIITGWRNSTYPYSPHPGVVWASWLQIKWREGILAPSWLQVGAKLGPSYVMLGPSWGQVGASWGLGAIGSKLGPSWANWGQVGAKLGPSWSQMGTRWMMPRWGCELLTLHATHCPSRKLWGDWELLHMRWYWNDNDEPRLALGDSRKSHQQQGFFCRQS